MNDQISKPDNPAPKPPEQKALLKKAVAALGWPELLAALSECANSEPGKKECASPRLFNTAAACEQALQETGEMAAFYESGDPPPPAPIRDVFPLVETARAEGIIEPEGLVKIMGLLEHAKKASSFFSNHAEAERLSLWASKLDGLAGLQKTLVQSIDRDGTVLDAASSNLKSLRSRHRSLKGKIHRRLSEIVARDPETVIQDSFYTQRGQRYVVPVRASEQNKFEGIVHDASGSGQTVFMEPAELVEQNNRLKLTEAEIETEIIRVLKELSLKVAEDADAIITNQRTLAHLDVVRARARLALELGAHRPRVNDTGRVALTCARHPLLLLQGQEVVANDIEMGSDCRVLLVSGPNAGGKTVGLTMLGLFSLMVRAGMFIPADPGSQMALFNEVYAVIGDEQDISRDLSSFSAHLLDMIGILEVACPSSLVLLDELMSSTDPDEGTALGAALLSALGDRGALVMATTHFPGLKSFAHEEPGFTNASYAFDPDTLRPTYRLVTGIPGRSLGIEMAARLGLQKDLIERARTQTDESAQKMESLIGELSKKMAETEHEKEQYESQRKQALDLAEQYRTLRERIAEQEKQLRRTIKARVREAIREAEDELAKIVAPVKSKSRPSHDGIVSAREKLRKMQEHAEAAYGDVDEETGQPNWSGIGEGDRVMIMPLGIEAVVMERPEGEVGDDTRIKVEMGQLRVMVEAKKVRAIKKPGGEAGASMLRRPPAKKKKARKKKIVPAPKTEKTAPGPALPQTQKNTLDMRGMRVHEAEGEVEHFLDRACRDHLSNVYIIHGHGTGALKQVVRELLELSPYVDDFRPGEKGEGGDGVTMAQLKEWGFPG